MCIIVNCGRGMNQIINRVISKSSEVKILNGGMYESTVDNKQIEPVELDQEVASSDSNINVDSVTSNPVSKHFYKSGRIIESPKYLDL